MSIYMYAYLIIKKTDQYIHRKLKVQDLNNVVNAFEFDRVSISINLKSL